jgi:hypothetical protein
MPLPIFTFPPADQLRSLPASPPIFAPSNRATVKQPGNIPSSGGFQSKGSDLSHGLARDRFGQSIALSADGQILAVGAPHNYATGHGRGMVQIYRTVSDRWEALGTPIPGRHSLEFAGWSVALSANGQILAIAAPGSDFNGAQSGSVQLYRYQNAQWSPMGAAIQGGSSLDLAGAAIALAADGSTIAIGSTLSDQGGHNHGQVQIYHYQNARWEALGNSLTGQQTQGNFGSALALAANGRTLAIGAAYTDGPNGNRNSGRVDLYAYNAVTNQWQAQAPLQGESARALFGHAVALSDDGQTLAVGAIGSQNDRGAVQTYRQINGQWQLFGSAITGKTANEGLGDRLVLSGDGQTLSVSTSSDIRDPGRMAHVRTYRWIDEQWVIIGETVDGGEFGTGLALSRNGQRLAIGLPGNEQALTMPGRVRLLDYQNQPPQLQLATGLHLYRRRQPPLNLMPNATIRDDSGQWQGGQLTATIAQPEPGDRLSLKLPATSGLQLLNQTIQAAGQSIGTYRNDGSRLDFSLNERARTAQISALLQGLHYDRDDAGLPHHDRRIQLQLTDRDGGTTTAFTQLKHISPNQLLRRHRRSQRLHLVTFDPQANDTRAIELRNSQNQPMALTEDWRIAATGDLDRDGIADLVLHSPQRDEVQIWRLQADGQVQPISVQGPNSQILRTGNRDWQLVGLADLTGDQQLDLVWQNRNADAVAFWQLNAQQQVTQYDVLRDRQGNLLKTGNSNWQIQGVADFDGDGDRDLLYRLPALNHTAIVRLEQTTFIDAHLIAAAPGPDWTIAAALDGNGDGIHDLYWQSLDRQQVQFQAVTLNGNIPVAPNFTGLNLTGSLAAISDLNQDAIPDLLLSPPQTPNLTLSPRQWDRTAMTEQSIDLRTWGNDWEVLQINAFGQD